MPTDAPDPKAEWQAICDAHHEAFIRFIKKWPAYGMKAAVADLGCATARVDVLGGDPEGFLRALRAREAKPDFRLVPNPKARS